MGVWAVDVSGSAVTMTGRGRDRVTEEKALRAGRVSPYTHKQTNLCGAPHFSRGLTLLEKVRQRW